MTSLILFNAEIMEAKNEKQFGHCLISIDHAGKPLVINYWLGLYVFCSSEVC